MRIGKTTLVLLGALGLIHATASASEAAVEDTYGFNFNDYAQDRYDAEDGDGDEWETTPYYNPYVRAQVNLEIAEALSSEGWWDFLPNKTRQFLKPILNFTNPIGNQLYDKWQARLKDNLENFDSDNVKGLMKLIPKKIREATADLAKAMANPLNDIGDRLQDGTNKVFQDLAEV